MKSPNSQARAGAFRMTSTATLNSPVDAMRGHGPASPERRFRWCTLSHSVQPLKIRKGTLV